MVFVTILYFDGKMLNGGYSAKHVTYRTSAEFSLVEIPSDEAPIVIRASDSDVEHLRFYEGKFFAPFVYEMDGGQFKTSNAALIQKLLGAGPQQNISSFSGFFDCFNGKRCIPFDGENEAKKAAVDDFNKAISSVRDFENNAIIVEGRIYIHAGIPHFKVTDKGVLFECAILDETDDFRKRRMYHKQIVSSELEKTFSLSELQDAIAYHERNYPERQAIVSKVEFEAKVSSIDFKSYQMLSIARNILFKSGSCSFNDLDVDAIEILLPLKKLLSVSDTALINGFILADMVETALCHPVLARTYGPEEVHDVMQAIQRYKGAPVFLNGANYGS